MATPVAVTVGAEESKVWSRAHLASLNHSAAAEDKQIFRRKFLKGLEFYCVSPSLILNSDLPADLVEFVTGQGFPVEALGVILELKKASASGSKNLEGLLSSSGGVGSLFNSSGRGAQQQINPQKLAEVSRKLVEHWMTSDNCAEAFVSLSLGDEIPGLIAETASFHRILFAIPDCFHLSSADFVKFLLNQCRIALGILAYGIGHQNYPGKIRSQTISSFLDRIFLRFHSDSEHFYPFDESNHKGLIQEDNPFVNFINDVLSLCKENFIAKRLNSKILLGLGTNSGGKVAKSIFLAGYRESCPASELLYPPEEFLEKSSVWEHILCSSIPQKSATKSKQFWANWAHFIYSNSSKSTEVWKGCVENWRKLCISSAVDKNILIPATCAVIGLGREIKLKHGDKSAIVISEAVKVFDSVAKCLDSTIEEKKACGMALAQIMGDLHACPNSKGSGDEQKKLKFESSSSIFHEFIEFYEKGYVPSVKGATGAMKGLNIKEKETRQKKVEVLDSDDEFDDDEVQGDTGDNAAEGNIDTENVFDDSAEEFPIDERILDIRSKKGKLPTYFSEIIEVLLEGGGQSKLESEVEALKYIAVMRISVLICAGVRIDANMATSLARCLIDYDGETSLEMPLVFGLLEISSLHPFEVFDVISQAAFDHEHYTSGQRMIFFRRLSEIIQLVSKEKCFSCFITSIEKNKCEFVGLCPEFITKYYETKTKMRFCSTCIKNPRLSIKCEESFPTEEESDAESEILTWREIVDRRVQAKTRYFTTPKRKTQVVVPDEYSTKIVPIAWASLANRLMSRIDYFMDKEERKVRGAPNDMLLAQAFRLLGRILLGTGSSTCPHLGNIATQVGELVRGYISHEDPYVRQAVIALLAIIVSISDGAGYIIEAVSGGQNIMENLKALREREKCPENQSLLDHTSAFLAQAIAIDFRLKFDISSSDDMSKVLRILPEKF